MIKASQYIEKDMIDNSYKYLEEDSKKSTSLSPNPSGISVFYFLSYSS